MHMAAVAIALSFASILHAQISFNFTYTGTAEVGFNNTGASGTAAKAALESAASTLAGYFTSSGPVTLTYTVNSYSTNDATLASAGSDSLSGSPGFHRTVVQNKIITGADSNGGTADGAIDWNWHHTWDTTDSVTSGFDLKSTAMHELLHSFGFLSNTEQDPSANTNWAIFDQYLTTNAGIGSLLINSSTYEWQGGGSVTTGGGTPPAFATGGIYFSGANALAANGGSPIPIYSPTAYEVGSSGSHTADNYFDATTAALLLMNSASDTGQGIRTLSAIELGILKDIGYSLSSVPEPSTYALIFGMGSLLVVVVRRRRRV